MFLISGHGDDFHFIITVALHSPTLCIDNPPRIFFSAVAACISTRCDLYFHRHYRRCGLVYARTYPPSGTQCSIEIIMFTNRGNANTYSECLSSARFVVFFPPRNSHALPSVELRVVRTRSEHAEPTPPKRTRTVNKTFVKYRIVAQTARVVSVLRIRCTPRYYVLTWPMLAAPPCRLIVFVRSASPTLHPRRGRPVVRGFVQLRK